MDFIFGSERVPGNYSDALQKLIHPGLLKVPGFYYGWGFSLVLDHINFDGFVCA